MPELVQLDTEWKEKGVRVLAVSVDMADSQHTIDTPEQIGAFAEARDMTMPVLAFEGDTRDLLRHFGLQAMPLTLAVNAAGEIVDSEVGAASKERFEEMIASALE